MNDLSKLRQFIHKAQQKQLKIVEYLLKSRPYVAAQVYERYKKCGSQNCKCHSGMPHGPFLWIYQHKKGKPVLSTTIDSQKQTQAKEHAQIYKQWLKNRQELRELNQLIQTQLDEMETLLETDAKDFVTKRTRGRPRKEKS